MNRVLRLDIAGNPAGWMNHEEAIRMIATDRVLAELGDNELVYRGGWNRVSGLRSEIKVNSILLTTEHVSSQRLSVGYAPPLTNRALFERDGFQCMYCGSVSKKGMTRDHVIPQSRSGQNTWQNCVTACRSCNSRKRNRTPEEAKMPLLAIPFTPSHAEHLLLLGRRVLTDQRDFLQARFPRGSRLLS